MRDVRIIPGPVVADVLRTMGPGVLDTVAQTYLLHADKRTVNPDSYFLRFPDAAHNRIIALPAALLDDEPVAGLKWIASFPNNIQAGMPRASAVVVLNDADTGYPIALLEGAQISAARTAFSAALAVRHLRDPDAAPRSIAVVGAGVIARNVLEALQLTSGLPSEVLIHDLDPANARAFATSLQESLEVRADTTERIEDVFAQDMVLLTTTAGQPYIEDEALIRPNQIVLNISLRDLSPGIVLSNWNVLDDVEHCLKANTSPHLAEQATGKRDFIAGTISDLVRGDIVPDRRKGLIFSPFGLGVLDLALARIVFREACRTGSGTVVPDFLMDGQGGGRHDGARR